MSEIESVFELNITEKNMGLNNSISSPKIDSKNDENSNLWNNEQENLSNNDYEDFSEIKTGNEEKIGVPSKIISDSDDSVNESLRTVEEQHDRSDGSDSGLGSEINDERQEVTSSTCILEGSDNEASFLDRIPLETSISDKFQTINTEKNEYELTSCCFMNNRDLPPKKGNLKRKRSDLDESTEQKAKKKKGISFDSVTVYYFPRAQGFSCVPSQGGSTLGMGAYHSHVKKFTISEHAVEQRRIHRQVIQQLSSEKNTSNTSNVTSSEESESDEEQSDASESEVDLENYYFLQPVPTRQRRVLLRAAGVRKIESYERDDCKNIRTSREFCGCGCKGYCDPETCSCSQNGIKCQVDRLNFPCGCSRDNCGNSTGRIEFNPVRVRTHFIHTLMRLELEKKQENEDISSQGERKEDWRSNERLCYKEENNSNFFLHYGIDGKNQNPPSFNDLPSRNDSLDLYTFREDSYEEDSTIQDGNLVDRKHPFSSSPLTPSGHGFQFSSDPRYSDGGGGGVVFQATAPQYSPTSSSSNQYSTSPYHPSFTDFNTVFNPYQIYDEFQGDNQKNFLQNSSNNCNNYEYNNEEENQYTNLNPVDINNKTESFSDLLHGRYNNYTTFNNSFINTQEVNVNINENNENISENSMTNTNTNKNNSSSGDRCDNFGEIIKKSIVETVSA